MLSGLSSLQAPIGSSFITCCGLSKKFWMVVSPAMGWACSCLSFSHRQSHSLRLHATASKSGKIQRLPEVAARLPAKLGEVWGGVLQTRFFFSCLETRSMQNLIFVSMMTDA